MSSPRSLVALVATACLLLAACGDDDETGTGDSTTTTQPAVDADESTTTTETSVPDAEAQDPPADRDDHDEGGDPLVFVADLRGDAEIPGPGDPVATGRVEIESDIAGDLCFDMVATGLDSDVGGAHIHAGALDVSGDVVIDIGTPTSSEGDTDTWTDVCLDVDDSVIEQINADPAAFYANIHTATHGMGAIRGQLEQATIFDLTLS